MGSQSYFGSLSKSIHEIDPKTITIESVIDRGSYGTVKKGKWNGKKVAVKIFETHSEIEAFKTEVEVLRAVEHKNIITLFGMSVGPQCLIVMELATQGSLFNLLHKRIDIDYTKEHMFVWWAEIADAISYLHNLKPKPVIHRDLKSSNILLKDDHVKICDFGTACDVHTLMSNAKGTVAWMAPEVITTTNYNEKCDVYSFGIVMWEVFMRRIPFKGLNSYQVMQTVDRKKRPPLPQTVPLSIRMLIQLCWSHEPTSRPSFTSICQLLNKLLNTVSKSELDLPSSAPVPCPSTPEPGPSGIVNIFQPSPPRFPITPGSCSPSPTVATKPSVVSSTPKKFTDSSILPYKHVPQLPKSCELHKQHSQIYEELQILMLQLNEKKGLVKTLKDRHHGLQTHLTQLSASNEEKQLRFSILRSENESSNQQLNFVLDNH